MSVRFVQWLIHRRWLVLAALVVVTVSAGYQTSRVNFDNSIETWFIEADPSLATYDRFTEIFRADQIVIVGIFADDIFDVEVLAAIEKISSDASNLEFVDRVQSITNSTIVRRLGGIEARGLRERVLSSPLQRATLLSKDLDATAIVIYYARAGNKFRHKRDFVRQLRNVVADATVDVPTSVAITGGPVIGEAAKVRNTDDMTMLVPVMILVIVIIAYLVFRRVPLTLLPLAVVAMAVTWAFGLMSLVGWQMSMISAILIPLILAVGVAHSIHLISGYRVNLEQGLCRDDAVRSSVVRLLKPCFFATLTTAVGLLSLLVSDLEPVRQFAVVAAFGVMAAFAISISFLPVMLQMMPASDATGAALVSRFILPLLRSLHNFGQAYPRRILLGSLATAAVFLWLATRVEIGLDPMLWIPHGDSIRVDAERIDEAFGGGLSLEFLVTSTDGELGTPGALRQMEEFQAWLVENTTVAQATSVADLVKEAARVGRGEGAGGSVLPKLPFLTDTLLDALGRDDQLAQWITADYSTARIAARIPLTSAQEIVDEIPAIQQRIDSVFKGSGLDVQITGQAVLAGIMQTHMIDSQLYSFSVALAVVSIMMILLLRSFLLGFLAVVPNLLPIVIGLGAMTIFDIAFNPATVMIAAVALGIVVDDTVHMMTAFEREVRGGMRTPDAIRSSILEVGRPVLITSILLATGFALLMLGSFLPSRQIGGLIAIIVIAALITDLVVLPAVLRESAPTNR